MLQRCHRKQNNCERSTYYTTITLIDQNIKYYNLNNKILHLISHMGFQVAPLIGVTEPSNSVPGNSDKQAQFLTADNFKIIWKLNKILVRVMRYNISDRTQKIISRELTVINPRVNYFEAARMIQTKIAQKDFKHLIQVRFYFHSREQLKKSAKN